MLQCIYIYLFSLALTCFTCSRKSSYTDAGTPTALYLETGSTDAATDGLYLYLFYGRLSVVSSFSPWEGHNSFKGKNPSAFLCWWNNNNNNPELILIFFQERIDERSKLWLILNCTAGSKVDYFPFSNLPASAVGSLLAREASAHSSSHLVDDIFPCVSSPLQLGLDIEFFFLIFFFVSPQSFILFSLLSLLMPFYKYETSLFQISFVLYGLIGAAANLGNHIWPLIF